MSFLSVSVEVAVPVRYASINVPILFPNVEIGSAAIEKDTRLRILGATLWQAEVDSIDIIHISISYIDVGRYFATAVDAVCLSEVHSQL